MPPQGWAARMPLSLFEQTQYEADQLFYATFPAARDAAYKAALEQNTYDLPSRLDFPTLHEATQPLEHDIRNELDISSTSLPFRGPTLEPSSYPQLHFSYSEGLHPQQHLLSHGPSQLTHYSPPRPIENEALVYIPPKKLFHHQYPSEPASRYIHQYYPSQAPAREPTFLVYQSLNISPKVNTDIQETVSDDHCESPRYGFRQLNRHMKLPTLKLTNNCQLGVMRLDQLSDRSHLDSPEINGQSLPSPSETLSRYATPCPLTPPTEFLLNSAQSPSIGLSSLPTTNIPKKPVLACLFCRGRKIACGPPLPGSIKKTCNQCRKRSLQCYYPTENRRGMRKKKPQSEDLDANSKDTTTKVKRKKKKKTEN